MNANAPNTASCTTCCVCCKEIPLDAAFTPEGALYRRRCQSDPSGSALVFAFLPNKLLETKSKAPRTIAISARLKAGQCQSRQ